MVGVVLVGVGERSSFQHLKNASQSLTLESLANSFHAKIAKRNCFWSMVEIRLISQVQKNISTLQIIPLKEQTLGDHSASRAIQSLDWQTTRLLLKKIIWCHGISH